MCVSSTKMCPGDAQALLENKHKPLKSPTMLYVGLDRSMQSSCFPSAFLGERRSSFCTQIQHTEERNGNEYPMPLHHLC